LLLNRNQKEGDSMKLKRAIVLGLLMIVSVAGMAMGGQNDNRRMDRRENNNRMERRQNGNANWRWRHRRHRRRHGRRRT
jgi:Ni/Co efflux regulator RcnB